MRSPRPSTIRRRVVALCVALCVALAGCNSKSAPREGGAAGGKADKARKDAEALALSAVNGGADAQAVAVPEAAVRRTGGGPFNVVLGPTKTGAVAKGPPAPKTSPRPGAPAVVRERVVSALPAATEAEAEDDALAQARDLVEQKLAALDPPVRHKPSIGEVRAEFVRKDSRTVRGPDAREKAILAEGDLVGNFVFVEYDVEVTADQVRELRAQERVAGGLRVLGVLTAVALAGFLFLRADEWTRGYLTSWLALGAVALAAGTAAALICI